MSLIFNRVFGAEWSISPLIAHIYITPIEKEPPSLWEGRGMASRPKMYPTRLALQCKDIVVQKVGG